MSDNIERERDFYRQQCNDLGARLLRLQEEQIWARRDARRSRTTATLIREVYRLAGFSVEEIGQQFLQIILDTLSAYRATLLQYLPEQECFVAQHTLGFPPSEQPSFTSPRLPGEYHFANSNSAAEPLLDCLRQAAGVPYLLWAFNARAGLALLVGNAVEDQHLHRPFEAGDREIVEGALTVFIEIMERKQAEEALQKAKEELELRVAERTVELTKANEQLQLELVERRRAEEALRESEERFRQVVSSISDHVYMTEFTKEGKQINRYISPNVETLTGYPPEKFMTDWSFWPSTLIHPEDRAAAAGQAQRFAQGQNSEMEYRLIRADGDMIWVRDSGRVEKDSSRQSLIVYGVVGDITERKRAEEALKESEEKFRTLAETITTTIFIHSGQQFRYGNSAAEILTGYSRTELMAMNFWDLVHPDFQEIVKERAMARLQNREQPPARYELKILNRAGQERWIDLTTGIIEFEGQPAILGTAFDITHRKQVEQALIQANEKAMEANRLKSKLLANVSHDLRTPLNAILGYTEMLQEGVYGPLSNKQHTATAEIIDSTARLLDFINNLLNQAEIESGRVVLNVINFSPTDLLDTIHSAMSTTARAKGLTLTTSIATDVPATLSGDPYWLRQILFNLVSNALKFTGEGTVHINIHRPNAAHWALQVSDTGCGIPEEARSYIFEPFQRGDGTATQTHTGSGLGLSIVKHLATLMNGQVTLESQIGQGSIFTILLPLHPIQEEAHD